MPESAQAYRTLLGFDHGGAHIGVAVGEELTRSARPLCTLHACEGEPDWAELGRLLSEWRPELLVVGVPWHADGSASKSTAAALAFRDRLQTQTAKPVFTVDERLSSREAQQRLSSGSQRRSARQLKTRIHQAAAAVILETWLQQSPALKTPR